VQPRDLVPAPTEFGRHVLNALNEFGRHVLNVCIPRDLVPAPDSSAPTIVLPVQRHRILQPFGHNAHACLSTEYMLAF
jgi:hypothetical protein